jgi:site-specific recombinase XerC
LHGHKEVGGRWQKAHLTKLLNAIGVLDNFRIIRSMFNWLEKDEAIAYDPVRKVSVPVARTKVKQPISAQHIRALLDAAKRSLRMANPDQALLCRYRFV